MILDTAKLRAINKIVEVCYADEMVLITKDQESMDTNFNVINKELESRSMRISQIKTKTTFVGKDVRV